MALHRLTRTFVRGTSTQTAARESLLRKIYAPFAKLEKGTPQYRELASSGKVWEDYHQPGNSDRLGYTKLNTLFSPSLREIDSLKVAIQSPKDAITRSLVAEYAHQSVQYEDNKLRLGASISINDHLVSNFFRDVNLASTPACELSQETLPNVLSIVPDADPSQIAELRNHIVASHWVTETALKNPNTVGLAEDEIRHLSALIIKDTSAEDVYNSGWGGKVAPGDFRKAPISVRSHPLRVFPYPTEVPAVMKRFIQWREKAHLSKELHPIVLACQICAYFLHIHPFPDGNGRVGRLIMQDFLIRQGYFPVVLGGSERPDYLRMIKNAQDGEPEEFVASTVTNHFDGMHTFRGRDFDDATNKKT